MANPVVNTIFAADPSAHVFDGRLYVYVSYDEPGTNTHDSMTKYHCLSTNDLVQWTDHGQILSLADVDWALSHMWAIDCNRWQDRYYLVFCAIDADTSTFRTGLAVSDRPEGPFTDLGPIAGVEWGQDPSLFIDDDTPYLVWGGRGAILIAELNADLRSVRPETIRNLSADLAGYEGPFLHKYRGRYYLTFPALDEERWPQRMCYAVADTVLGPYEYKGVFIPAYEGNSGTIHGSVVEFLDAWWAFYHSAWGSGTATSRSLMVDRLTYNAAGEIAPIQPSVAGPFPGVTRVEVLLDAASAAGRGGRVFGARVVSDHSGHSGHGYVTGLVQQEFGVSMIVDVGRPASYAISLRYRNPGPDFHGRLMLANHLFYDGNQNQSYEDYINRGTLFEHTAGQWQEIEIGQLLLAAGSHTLRFSASHNLPADVPGIDLDWFRLEPLN